MYCTKVVLTPLIKLSSYELKFVNICLGFITNVEGRGGMEKPGEQIVSACRNKTRKNIRKRPRNNVKKTPRWEQTD